jgi:predicted Zn-dependent protease
VNTDVPWAGLEIDLGGWDQDRVIFTSSDGDLAGWSFYCHDRRVLNERMFTQRTELRSQIQEFRQQRDGRRRVRLTFLFLILFVFASAIAYVASGSLTGLVVNRIPVSVEKQIGTSVRDGFEQEGKITSDPVAEARLGLLAERLGKAERDARYTFEVHVLKMPLPNAFAVPGGQIFFTTGMLELTSDPEELAGIMAHEIAHVTQRHGLRKLVSSAGPMILLAALFGSDGGLLATLGQGSAYLLQQRFSRDFEREADLAGWRNMVAANIDPRGMTRLMAKLQKFEQGQTGGGDTSLSILGSHPPTQERVERFEELWRKESKKTGYGNLATDPLWLKPEIKPAPGNLKPRLNP